MRLKARHDVDGNVVILEIKAMNIDDQNPKFLIIYVNSGGNIKYSDDIGEFTVLETAVI